MGGDDIVVLPSTSATPSDWARKRLENVCEGIFDCPHSTPVRADGGPYLARSQDIRSGVFRTEEAARVSEATYRERVARAEPRHGDLLYSREGTYFGIAAEVPNGVRLCLGQRMVLLRPAPSVIDFRFLRYWLNSPAMAIHTNGQRDGSVAERLNLPTIRGLPVAVPPIPTQRRIAHILRELDEKIELNRRMSETLEAVSRALFKSWFVDVDVPSLTAGELEAEGILEIGDGYRAKNTELGRPGVPFIRAGDLNNGFDTDGAEYLHETSVAKAGSKVAQIGDVAFTSKGTIGRFTRVSEHVESFVYSPQVCFWRSRELTRLHPAVLYCWMQSGDFRDQIMAVASQTDMAP